MIGKLSAAGIVIALPTMILTGLTSLVSAPVANADNQSYLNAVSSLTSIYGPESLLKIGKGSCSLLAPTGNLWFGRNPNWVAQMVWENNPLFERNQAAVLVNAAIDNLCPGVNALGYADAG